MTDAEWRNTVDNFLERAHRKWAASVEAVLEAAEQLTDYDDPRSDWWTLEYEQPRIITSHVSTPDFYDNNMTLVIESDPPRMWHERIVPWDYLS